MSIELLKSLNGDRNGLLKSFIDKYENVREPRLAWYPSAAPDFRALLYVTKKYSIFNPARWKESALPELFIFTDYGISGDISFLENNLVYEDKRTNMTILNYEIWPVLNGVTDKLAFLDVRVESMRFGVYEIPIIYAFPENLSFLAELLLSKNGILSHVIHIRNRGGSENGGIARSAWILYNYLRNKNKVNITGNNQSEVSSCKAADMIKPKLVLGELKYKIESSKIVSKLWSYNGIIGANEVKQ